MAGAGHEASAPDATQGALQARRGVERVQLLMVDNVNFYYNFQPKGDHEYTLV